MGRKKTRVYGVFTHIVWALDKQRGVGVGEGGGEVKRGGRKGETDRQTEQRQTDGKEGISSSAGKRPDKSCMA